MKRKSALSYSIFIASLFALFVCSFSIASAEDPLDVLFVTKSSGYEHEVVNRKNGALGHAEEIMLDVAQKHNFRIVITKDAGLINKRTLKQFDVVQFYTSGNLCQRGGDGNPPMSTEGREALLEWVEKGGAFVGTHSATDTFRKWNRDGKKPYTEMIGGAFKGHGKQQVGTMTVKQHPTTAHLDEEWKLKDEYYVFSHLTDDRNKIITVDTASLQGKEYKGRSPYATTWYKSYGKGRVWYTALGHRKDVWSNPNYQKLVARGIQWAAGKLE